MRRKGLVTARKTVGKSQERVAEEVSVDRSTIGTWERGEYSPRAEQRIAYADSLGITLEELDGLLTGIPSTNGTPLWLRQYLGLEQSASTIRTHEPHAVHGLLQTKEYAAGIARSVGITEAPESYVKRNVEQRQERQGRVTQGSDLDLHVIQSEISLRLRLGSPPVMAEQLDHLARLADQSNVTLQIVPFGVGQYEALRIGSLDIMTHPWAEGVSVWVHRYGDAMIVDDVDEAGHLVSVFQHAEALAFTPSDSAAFVAEVADQWRRSPHEQHLA